MITGIHKIKKIFMKKISIVDATTEQMQEQNNLVKKLDQGYLQNPMNRYRVVYYKPSVQQLKTYYKELVAGKHGYAIVFEECMKRIGYQADAIELLMENNNDFFEIIAMNRIFHPAKVMIGIQENSTGKIIDRGYRGIYSYHPEEGYVIFNIETARDLIWGVHESFQIVSLKNGLEIGSNLVETSITGIKDLTFLGIRAQSNFYMPQAYKIVEEINDFKELEFQSKKLVLPDHAEFLNEIVTDFQIPDANWTDRANFGIETILTGVPCLEDPDYLNAITTNPRIVAFLNEEEDTILE